MKPRAVITGIGLVTPIGSGVRKYWNALIHGQSGIGNITLFDTTGHAVKIGGEVKDIDFSRYISSKQSRKMSRATKYAIIAASMALEDSGLEITDENRDGIDVFLGVACPDVDAVGRSVLRRHRKGGRGVDPRLISEATLSAPASNIAITLGVSGETLTISTACSSSTNAIGHALRKIRSRASQIIFAGGADTGLQIDLISCFSNAHTLSTRNCDPEGACRPFEVNRDGHVISDAAGVMVIEEYEHAKARDARIYAELAGYGVSSDCHSMGSVSQDEGNSARCIKETLRDAGRDPEQVNYYCAHGTSARVTDARETRMLKRVLGTRAYRVPVSSIKSMTGHPFGASGVLQAATCALAIKERVVPPTINYQEPDPDCDLDYVPNEAREENVEFALTYSLGMGNNASLAFAAC